MKKDQLRKNWVALVLFAFILFFTINLLEDLMYTPSLTTFSSTLIFLPLFAGNLLLLLLAVNIFPPDDFT